jgi:hypothetical protein
MTTAHYRDLSNRRDDVKMDRECIALLTGADVDDIPPGGVDALPAALLRNGRRRLKEYEAATGRSNPDVRDLLVHYAARDGVELVRLVGEDMHAVVVAGPTPTEDDAS